MSDSRQQPTEPRGSLKRQFYQALCHLAQTGQAERLDWLLDKLERLMDVLEAEQILKAGWEGEGESMP